MYQLGCNTFMCKNLMKSIKETHEQHLQWQSQSGFLFEIFNTKNV